MQMSELSAADVLDRAADLIERGGHLKQLYMNNGALCALGGLMAAVGSDESIDPYHDPRTMIAADTLWRYVGAVARWNDAPERTKDDVTSTLRACAALLRARESAPAPAPVTEVEYDHV
jgi:hypothetical protein